MIHGYGNGKIFDGERFWDESVLLCENGKILARVSRDQCGENIPCFDLKGGILAPGFVDIQVNGGGGVMFNEAVTEDDLETMVAAHRRFGTTSLLPTLISDSLETMQKAARLIQRARQKKIPAVRGIHFEGPYINVHRKGVHRSEMIRAMDEEIVDLLISQDLGVSVLTVAPEKVPGRVIKKLVDAGVRVCAGHSDASFAEMEHAFAHGVKGITHLFNAMSPFQGREPGVVGAALADPDCWCGIILDGFHVHPASIRVVTAAKQRGKVILVTDAMATVGAKIKEFWLNGELIKAADGKCATAAGVLAGSDLDMAAAVRNCLSMLDFNLEEALRMASLYPAEFIGLAGKIGRLQPGYDEDLVLLNKQLRVEKTWIGGKE